ncbi:MAG: N-acetyl-gamma-glutamyl-phosphate reductase [Spirochaetales bacterium]|nr:N-acetyl-gamma-glutamyl-phosphate reductase [Spirochaetales bacterium]
MPNKYKIFIDGQEGTTGLEINERLQRRDDVEIMRIDSDKRKDVDERRKFINDSDITILCLPDVAAKESVSLVNPDNNHTKIIDASTAHRTNPDWAYGLPELSPEHRKAIAASNRISNPGCYASGFASLIYPIVKCGIMQEDFPVTCNAISGYSGAGKKLINVIESDDEAAKIKYSSPNMYALGLTHKHVPEMQMRNGLKYAPIFVPSVCNYYRGMLVAIPIITRLLAKPMTPTQLCEFYKDYYKEAKFVQVNDFENNASLDGNFLNALGCNNTNNLQVNVFGNDDQILLVSQLDNLGKGASGAAVQNLNIVMGKDESSFLK